MVISYEAYIIMARGGAKHELLIAPDPRHNNIRNANYNEIIYLSHRHDVVPLL